MTDPLPTETRKHTAGPWRVDPTHRLCIESAANGNVALVNLARSSEADARLIAAAPDLLEALKLLYREMELSGNLGSKQYGWPEATTKSQAAIAKAEGRS